MLWKEMQIFRWTFEFSHYPIVQLHITHQFAQFVETTQAIILLVAAQPVPRWGNAQQRKKQGQDVGLLGGYQGD